MLFVSKSAHQWDLNLDMCRLCAKVQAEEAGHRRAHLVAVEEEGEQRVQQGFTIRIPPRIHCICALCHVDYLLSVTYPCQKSEKCSRCRKIKKKKRFRKVFDWFAFAGEDPRRYNDLID